MHENFLKQLGLSANEIAIYLILLEGGVQTVTDVAKKSGLHRQQVYRTLDKLQRKELVSKLSGNKRKYVAESPKKLRDLVARLSGSIDTVVSDLENIKRAKGTKPNIKYLEGRKGVTFVFSDVVNSLKKGDVFYRYSTVKDQKKTNSYLPKDYREKRDNKKLERFLITNAEASKLKKVRLEREIKLIPESFNEFKQDVIEIIYGNKVALIDLNSETSLIIENAPLAEFQKTVYRLLYKNLPTRE